MKRLLKTLGQKLQLFKYCILKVQRLVELNDTLNEQEHYFRFRQNTN